LISNSTARKLTSSGVTASSSFGISGDDSAHIMTILRDTLYSDKVLAPLREYSSNAWDANRDAGKKDLPIKVTLPTKLDPTLYIQDFGLGLSETDMFQVYTQYGKSTKRNSDDVVGQFGIGSKSAFAYSDSFTITSRHGGMCRTYVAVLDESNKGSINLLNEEECDEDETGITIQIPVKPEDIWDFNQKAESLFQYFEPRPEINIKLPDLPAERQILSNGILNSSRGSAAEWVAVMGCVPYKVDLDQLEGAHNPDGGIGNHIKHLSGVLYFNIGDVQVSASREGLKYSTSTKAALIKKFNDLVDEYVRTTIAALEDDSKVTIWEKRVRAQILNHLRLPIPKEFKDLLETSLEYKAKTKTFVLTSWQSQAETTSLYVGTDTRIFLRDDLRNTTGFHDLKYHDYLVRMNDGEEWEDVEEELEKLSIKLGFYGVPVLKLSSLNWTPPPVKTPKLKQMNDKHRVSTFKLQVNAAFTHPWSDIWTIEKRVPTKDDVFVILKGFRTDFEGEFDIYRSYKNDKDIIVGLGETMPEIYGYKSTKKKPVLPEQRTGTHYPEWREKVFHQIAAIEKIRKQLAVYEAAVVVTNDYHGEASSYTVALDLFGVKHPITRLLKRQREAKRIYSKLPEKQRNAISRLYEKVKATNKFDALKARDDIYAKYPLVALSRMSELWGKNSIHWAEYIKLIDKVRPQNLTPVIKDEEEEEDDDNIFDE